MLKCSLQTAQVPKQVKLCGAREKGAQGCLPEEGEGIQMISMAAVVSQKWETVLTRVSFREIASGHAKAKAKE